MSIIKLWTSDNEILRVDSKAASTSNLLRDFCMSVEEGPLPVPLTSNVLRKVIIWATHHKDDPLDGGREEIDSPNDITRWDTDFPMSFDMPVLFDLLKANYLDMKGLLASICIFIANMIKDTSPLEICRTFRLSSEMGKEDEKSGEW